MGVILTSMTVAFLWLAEGAPDLVSRQGNIVEQSMLSDEGARAALGAALEEAKARKLDVSIAVVDRNGQLLAFARVDGAFPATIDNAIAKASTAAQLGSPTRILQDAVDGGRTSYLAIKGMVPLQGGVPIVFNGTVLGGIGCSGADAAVDELIANVGAEHVVLGQGSQD